MTTAASPRNLHPPRSPDEETDADRIYRGVSFASDDWVPWILGSLRLGKADLTRMRSSGVPVLRAHEPDNIVGAVTRVEKANGLWRSDWRLPKIPANETTFQQMDSGILRGISVGGNLDWSTLQVDNEDEADWSDPDSLRFSMDWMLVEQSLTAIPADTRVGIDRAAVAVLERDAAIFDSVITPEGVTTLQTSTVLQRLESRVKSHNENLTLRRQEATMTTQPIIPADALERAITEAMGRNEGLQKLACIPDTLDALRTAHEAEEKRNLEYRAKLDQLQFQPNGQVLQMSNWSPLENAPLDLGKILRLTSVDDLGFPALERSGATLEESFLEQLNLEPANRSTLARIPFAAIEERQRQLQLQRNTVAGGAGARMVDIHILGDGGLLLNAFSPILGSMNVRSGLTGGQKQPYWTAQGTAAGGAEASDIPVATWTLDNAELLPVSIASAFSISSSLRAADDMTFESLVYTSIMAVCGDELVSQVLDGGGSASNEIAGLWGRVSAANPDRQHRVRRGSDRFRTVRYSRRPESCGPWQRPTAVPASLSLGGTLWQLAQNTLRGGHRATRFLLGDDGWARCANVDGNGAAGGEGRISLRGLLANRDHRCGHLRQGRPLHHLPLE